MVLKKKHFEYVYMKSTIIIVHTLMYFDSAQSKRYIETIFAYRKNSISKIKFLLPIKYCTGMSQDFRLPILCM